MYWLRLFIFQEIRCLLNFHYDVGRQGLEIYPCIKFHLPQCFSLSVTCTYVHVHTYAIKNVLPETVFQESIVYIILTMGVTELYLSAK